VEAGEQAVTPDTIVKEAREAVEATAQYTAQEKAAFQRKAEEEIAAIQQRMAALQAKADKASAAARTELQKSIHELEVKKEAVKQQLDGLKAATDAKWNEMRAGVHSAIEEMNQSFQRLRSKLQ
jgi:predicted RNase H-like nuclease (RuvC/YqgF family)